MNTVTCDKCGVAIYNFHCSDIPEGGVKMAIGEDNAENAHLCKPCAAEFFVWMEEGVAHHGN